MTTDRQRDRIRGALLSYFGDDFTVTTYRDEVTLSFPIMTPAGRRTIAHERYASATTCRNLDGRKPVTAADLLAMCDDLTVKFDRGTRDPRYTDQARDDYAAAVAAMGRAGVRVA